MNVAGANSPVLPRLHIPSAADAVVRTAFLSAGIVQVQNWKEAALPEFGGGTFWFIASTAFRLAKVGQNGNFANKIIHVARFFA